MAVNDPIHPNCRSTLSETTFDPGELHDIVYDPIHSKILHPKILRFINPTQFISEPKRANLAKKSHLKEHKIIPTMKNIYIDFFALTSAATPWKDNDANQLDFYNKN